MFDGQKVTNNFNFMIRCLAVYAAAGAMGAACTPPAFAQGGQTEVVKTAPANPPAVAALPSPAAAAPSPAAAAPSPAVAETAAKPVSPIGSGAAWQANVAQPKTPQAEARISDQALIAKVNDYFNKLTDLQGIFLQTDPDGKQKRGRFYFQRPGRVRFDYATPSSLKIVSDGRYLAIEDRNMNTSERYPLDVTPFKLLLSETVDLAKDARILSVEQGPDMAVLTVEDKSDSSSGRIRIFFNKADMSLKEWIITDAQGLDTRIEVSNLEPNKKVAENFFIISALGFDKDQ